MEIFSPDNCFVLTTVPAGPVQSAATLITLLSPAIEKLLERITTFEAMLDIYERKFSDGRVADQVKLQVDMGTNMKAQRSDISVIAQVAQRDFDLGQITLTTLLDVKVRLAGQDSLTAKQELTVAHADREITDQKDRLAVMKRHVVKEKALALDLKDRLTIRAPLAGSFSPKCLSGLFYKKGQSLGDII